MNTLSECDEAGVWGHIKLSGLHADAAMGEAAPVRAARTLGRMIRSAAQAMVESRERVAAAPKPAY